MDVIQQEIQVTFRYPVYFTRDVFLRSNPLLKNVIPTGGSGTPARIVVVLDQGVRDAHPGLTNAINEYCSTYRTALELAAAVLVIPGGEQAKNDRRWAEGVLGAIHDAALCRHSYVAAVGGGAVLDVAGYAAATAHRGIRLIRIPTTVLSQDDSGVGVKNGINAFGKKNYVGTFTPPFAVINDFSFLTTLSDRDWRGGISEAVKAALIRDRGFFGFLEEHADRLKNRDMSAVEHVIRRSAALHLEHIATGGDPFELGSSRPLDFGHWSAHKLEQLTNHRLGHGESVAIGISLDTTYAYLAGYLPEQDWRRIIDLMCALGLPLYAPELSHRLEVEEDAACVLHGLEEFREHLGGGLTIMLLKGIGQPFDVHEIRKDAMIRSIGILEHLARGRQRAEETHDYPISVEPYRTRRRVLH
jgi:3-dehydroquinate synthase